MTPDDKEGIANERKWHSESHLRRLLHIVNELSESQIKPGAHGFGYAKLREIEARVESYEWDIDLDTTKDGILDPRPKLLVDMEDKGLVTIPRKGLRFFQIVHLTEDGKKYYLDVLKQMKKRVELRKAAATKNETLSLLNEVAELKIMAAKDPQNTETLSGLISAMDKAGLSRESEKYRLKLLQLIESEKDSEFSDEHLFD